MSPITFGPAAFVRIELGEEGVATANYSNPFLDADGLGEVADVLAPELGWVSLPEHILRIEGLSASSVDHNVPVRLEHPEAADK